MCSRRSVNVVYATFPFNGRHVLVFLSRILTAVYLNKPSFTGPLTHAVLEVTNKEDATAARGRWRKRQQSSQKSTAHLTKRTQKANEVLFPSEVRPTQHTPLPPHPPPPSPSTLTLPHPLPLFLRTDGYWQCSHSRSVSRDME